MSYLYTLTMVGQIDNSLTRRLVPDLRPLRHGKLNTLTPFAVLLPTGASSAVSCPEYTVMPKTQERAYIPVTARKYASSITAVSPVRTAMRHKLLSPSADGPISPRPADSSYIDGINHEYLRV